MTTLFSSSRLLFLGGRFCASLLALLLATTTGSVFGQRTLPFGYVISPQDKARAEASAQEAFAAFQAGDYPKALDLIKESARLKPDQPDNWNLRGMIQLRQKNYAAAREAFGRATALDPDLWAAQFNLAEVAFQQREYPRAQKAFDHLLTQTDRFKQGSRWELVQYKSYLCSLLSGNPKAAEAKLVRLPAKNGATPARWYAEAARDFLAKKPEAAQKSVATAQGTFPAQVNATFADSLVQAGWQAAPTPAPAMLPTDPAASAGLPPGVTLALTPAPGTSKPIPYYAVDPRQEAAAAEPLPLPDAGAHPIVGKLMPVASTGPINAIPPPPKPSAPPVVVMQTTPAPQATPDVELEHKDLLLIE